VEYRLVKAARRGHHASGEAVPSNLPNYLTSFVGRADELDALKPLLAHSRMVTFTGSGGAGKSRLAAELGWACLGLWPAGVWWVELAPVSDPLQMPGAVVAALELPGRGQPRDVFVAWLAARRALLVLDNCEHLVAACADFCQAVLKHCPQLTILATSREALGVAGEARWPVSSLAVRYAIELFEARAQLAVADFKVDASNLETVTKICERLDCMPLAIELAAPRVGMMTEHDILSQLSDRFRLLTGGNRTAPERQQAMSTAIDWSYRLLTKTEAMFFRRSSVFRGGFTLDSAQAVCADGTTGGVLDLLTGLVQKSMVVAERTEGWGGRYRLLESQLAYAEDRLRETSEFEPTRRRHFEYFRDRVSAKSIRYTGPRAVASPPPGFAEARWLARESGNLWAALGWARNTADDLGLDLAADLAQKEFGELAQLRSLLEELLHLSPAKGLTRLCALRSAAVVAFYQGDYVAATGNAEASLALARDLGDPEEVAFTLYWAGSAHMGRAELAVAAEMYEEAISLVSGSSNHRLVSLIRRAIADLAFHRGDCTTARDIVAECLTTTRAEGDVAGTACCLDTLAWAQRGLNDHQAAAASWREALSIQRDLKSQIGIIDCLEGLSLVAEFRGDDRRAVLLAAAANRKSRDMSYSVDTWWFMQSEDSHRRSRARLGKRESEAAWNEGWLMSLDDAVEYALGESESENAVEAGPLSRRQKEVAKLVAAGLTNRQIADRLFIVERTAEGHVEQIRNRLGVRSRMEVGTWAVEHGLASGPDVSGPNATKERGTPSESPSTGRLPRA
jgi:predicted ATPase/DNA-binding CsgD family transcriptional regulator